VLAGKVGLEDAGVYDVIIARCTDVEEKFRFVRDTVGRDQTARRQLRIVQPARERVVQVLERIRIAKVGVPGAASKLRSKKENPPFVAFGNALPAPSPAACRRAGARCWRDGRVRGLNKSAAPAATARMARRHVCPGPFIP
jgi:hypothetical protein